MENNTEDTEHRAPRRQLSAHHTPPARPPRILRGSSHHDPGSGGKGRMCQASTGKVRSWASTHDTALHAPELSVRRDCQ